MWIILFVVVAVQEFKILFKEISFSSTRVSFEDVYLLLARFDAAPARTWRVVTH